MRITLAVIAVLAAASPALAKYPPPGVYQCADAMERGHGMLTLYAGGDYLWDGTDASMGTGQMSSAKATVEAITGPLKDRKWVGRYVEDNGVVTFAFETAGGLINCK